MTREFRAPLRSFRAALAVAVCLSALYLPVLYLIHREHPSEAHAIERAMASALWNSWIVLAILCGAELGGLPGILLSIPVIAVLSVAFRHWREHRADEVERTTEIEPAEG